VAADRHDGLSLALLRCRRSAPDDLRRALEQRGVRVVVEESISSYANALRWNGTRVDLLLLDLERADDAELDLLDRLLERVALPMIFHDGQARTDDVAWLSRLVAKMWAVTGDAREVAAPADEPQLPRDDPAQQKLRCWVLGASFGGPEALKRFLSAIPQPPPQTAFIIGQHIGDGFVEVMAGQLNRATNFKVVPATDGAQLESGRVFVAPVRERLRIDAGGIIRLESQTERFQYMPSIDRLMEEVALRFGRRSGAIVFSGMGDDGTRGCVAIARAGGLVWAQDSASSAIDSMPNCARATGAVRFSASPEELAAALAAHLTATAPHLSSRTA
jgi:chemosensory pili system protein ChpB (putative protein-glutamate methylesterase)